MDGYIKEIPFKNDPWKDECSYAKDFAKGKYLFCNGDLRGGFKLIEKAIIKGLSMEQIITQLNTFTKGWWNYFSHADVAAEFEKYLKSGSGIAFARKRLW